MVCRKNDVFETQNINKRLILTADNSTVSNKSAANVTANTNKTQPGTNTVAQRAAFEFADKQTECSNRPYRRQGKDRDDRGRKVCLGGGSCGTQERPATTEGGVIRGEQEGYR